MAASNPTATDRLSLAPRSYDARKVLVQAVTRAGLLSAADAERLAGEAADLGRNLLEHLVRSGRIEGPTADDLGHQVEYRLRRDEDKILARMAVEAGILEPEVAVRTLSRLKQRFAETGRIGRLDVVLANQGRLSEKAREQLLARRDEALVRRFGRAPTAEVPTAVIEAVVSRPAPPPCRSCGRVAEPLHGRCSICGAELLVAAATRPARARRSAPADRLLDSNPSVTLRLASLVLGGAFVLSFFLPVLPGVQAWDLLGEEFVPGLLIAFLFSPLVVGCGLFPTSLLVRRPMVRGATILGLAIVPVLPLALLLTLAAGLPIIGRAGPTLTAIACVLLTHAFVLAGSYLRIEHEERLLPRLGAGIAACLLIAGEIVMALAGVDGSIVDRTASSFAAGFDLGLVGLLPFLALVLAAVNLAHLPGWSRRIGLAVVVLSLGSTGYIGLRLLLAGLAGPQAEVVFPLARVCFLVAGLDLLLPIGLAFLGLGILEGRRGRSPRAALPNRRVRSVRAA